MGRWGPDRPRLGPRDGQTGHSGARSGRTHRGVSPILGTVLMVALTLLLASVIVAGLSGSADLSEERETVGIEHDTATGNPWTGSLSDLIVLSNDEAGASGVRVRINFTVTSGSDTVGNSLNSVETKVQSGSPMFSGTAQGDLSTAVVDTDGDGTGETDLESDLNGWTVSDGGSRLKIEFGGSAYTAAAGDAIIIVFGSVDNPTSPGTYTVEIQTSGDGNWQTGDLTID